MGIRDFIKKQFIDVIHWTEPEDGILAWRFPMQDMEIQNGAKLTVRESQMAAFVNEGRMADVLGPGLYTLNTNTLPLLTNLMNWDKLFQSPFKSDVYFFSTRLQMNQRWGTASPVTIRDKEFGAVRLRAFGIYSWRLADPRTFHTKSAVRASCIASPRSKASFATRSSAACRTRLPKARCRSSTWRRTRSSLAQQIAEHLRPSFTELGLALDTFVVENLSLPEELQKRLDERIGMNMIGDMGQYTQFQVAQSMPIAAANEGGLAGAGAGLGRGLRDGAADDERDAARSSGRSRSGESRCRRLRLPAVCRGSAVAAGETKFCVECGKSIPEAGEVLSRMRRRTAVSKYRTVNSLAAVSGWSRRTAAMRPRSPTCPRSHALFDAIIARPRASSGAEPAWHKFPGRAA